MSKPTATKTDTETKKIRTRRNHQPTELLSWLISCIGHWKLSKTSPWQKLGDDRYFVCYWAMRSKVRNGRVIPPRLSDLLERESSGRYSWKSSLYPIYEEFLLKCRAGQGFFGVTLEQLRSLLETEDPNPVGPFLWSGYRVWIVSQLLHLPHPVKQGVNLDPPASAYTLMTRKATLVASYETGILDIDATLGLWHWEVTQPHREKVYDKIHFSLQQLLERRAVLAGTPLPEKEAKPSQEALEHLLREAGVRWIDNKNSATWLRMTSSDSLFAGYWALSGPEKLDLDSMCKLVEPSANTPDGRVLLREEYLPLFQRFLMDYAAGRSLGGLSRQEIARCLLARGNAKYNYKSSEFWEDFCTWYWASLIERVDSPSPEHSKQDSLFDKDKIMWADLLDLRQVLQAQQPPPPPQAKLDYEAQLYPTSTEEVRILINPMELLLSKLFPHPEDLTNMKRWVSENQVRTPEVFALLRPEDYAQLPLGIRMVIRNHLGQVTRLQTSLGVR